MFIFSNSSLDKLQDAHNDLQLIFKEAIKYSPVDFGISQTYRSPETQFEIFKEGRKFDGKEWIIDKPGLVKTYKDGYYTKSKHNFYPSLAVDFYAYIENKPSLTWDKFHLAIIIGVLLSAAERLYEEGKISNILRSGADWNRNGEFLSDQSFDDMPHVELINKK